MILPTLLQMLTSPLLQWSFQQRSRNCMAATCNVTLNTLTKRIRKLTSRAIMRGEVDFHSRGRCTMPPTNTPSLSKPHTSGTALRTRMHMF